MLKIGVDGGGTTTRVVVIEQSDGDIKVLGRGESGSSNHYSVGPDGAARNISEAIDKALQSAGVAREQIVTFGFGLAGACTESEQALLGEKLSPLTNGRFSVDEDAAAAQSGAFAGEPGVVCIAGTGANSFGINASGQRARADGLGPLLGDRGGGYRIGEAALRAACSANDGSGPSTSLLQPCLDAFGVTTVEGLFPIVYDPAFKRDRVAALFRLVLEHAEKGDAVAQKLLNDAGRELAKTADSVLQQLGLARVAVVGGVIENAPMVRQALEDELRKTIADVEVISPRYDAIIGAALLIRDS